MAAAAAVPGERGVRGLVLKLGRDDEKVRDGSRLAGEVYAVKDTRRDEARSAGPSRRRRGASAAVLGVRARDGAAWRGREASRRSQRRGARRARRVAGSLNSTATSARQKTGEGESRESREKEREKFV